MTDLHTALADWRRCLNGHRPALDQPVEWDAIDAAEHAAAETVRAANRRRAYTNTLPTRYATATYRMLRPNQNPDGKVSRWWGSRLRTLMLSGPPRTGKTTAAYAVANDAHQQGQWVIARPAIDLSAAAKPDGDPRALPYARDCDLLLLDDLGQERPTDWWVEQMYGLVDCRASNNRRLIVTTNHGLDALADRYGEPILERLLDGGGLLTIDGPAIRHTTTDW